MLTEKTLGQGLATTSSANFYTCPTDTRAIITMLLISNVSGTDQALTIYADPTGNTEDDAHAIMKEMVIPANSMIPFKVYFVLEATGEINALAGANSSISLLVAGAELT